mgnify:CR=1 FL=1
MGKPYHLYTYQKTLGDDFTIIGHRGACAYYPENTMVSFTAAHELGAEMIETDVQLTKDRVPVLYHDEELQSCTNGNGRVATYTLSELRKLDAGSNFDPRFAGEKIPLLEELLEYARDRIALNLEIKTEAVVDEISGGVEELILTLVRRYGMEEHVVYSSFDPRAVLHLKEIDSSAACAILFHRPLWKKIPPHQIVSMLDADGFNCSKHQMTREWADDLKEHGIPVNVYTVNSTQGMRRLLDLGVNGIFSNRPDLLKKVVAGRVSRTAV